MLTRDGLSRAIAAISLVTLSCFTTGARAASWSEQGDAGSLPATAQITTGTGALDSISGTINGFNDADVYKIYVTGGGTFSASTHAADGGSANFDTMLFLFDANGVGVYTNDDVDASWRSRLPASNPLTPVAPGFYYLVITSWENDPVSSGGQIFPNLDNDFSVYGPTGPGGGSPVSGFDNQGSESGSYNIVLTGAQFAAAAGPAASVAVPTMPQWGMGILIALLGFAAAYHLRRHRRAES